MPSPFRRKSKEKAPPNVEEDSDLEEVVDAEDPIEDLMDELENFDLE